VAKKDTPRLPLGLSVGAPVPARKKPKVSKGLRPVGRPAPLVALHERYGLVYEPGEDADPIVKAELDALRELYRERTNREISDEPDTRVALESAGFLRPTVSRKRASELRGEASEAFASAIDALDWATWRPIREAVKRSPEAAKAVARTFEAQIPAMGLPVSIAPAVQEEAPTVGDVAKAGIGGAVREGVAAPLRGIEGMATTRLPLLGLPTDVRAGAQQATPTFGEVASRGVAETFTAAGGAARKAGRVPLQGLPGSIAESISPGQPTLGGVAGEIKRVQQDFATGRGSNQVSVEKQLEIAREQASLVTDENALLGELAFMEAAASGIPVADLNFIRDSLALGPLEKPGRAVYLKYARANGWNIANPRKYTDVELVKMAFTKPGARVPGTEFDLEETTRSYWRQVGEFAAAPMAIPAIIEAATSGDRAKQKAIIDAAIGPYVYLKDDIERRGLGPALSSFAQERPLDFILIANSIYRGLGRTAGATARTVGGTGGGLFQLLVPEATGGMRRTIGEFARTNRPITVPMPRVERGAGEVNLVPVAIAFTGKNLADTVATELYALGLRAGMRVDRLGVGRAARRLAGQRTARATRRAENMADDAAANATIELREATRGLSSAQLVRAALELTVARIRPDGEPYSFQQRADFFRELAQESLKIADGNPSKARASRKDAKRFFDQAEFYQRVADTPLDDALIEQLRTIAREVGGDNDTVVAMLMGQWDELDNPSGLKRQSVRYAELKPGERIDVGADRVEPAYVTRVETRGDGRLRVHYRSITNPRGDLHVDVLGAQRVQRLTAGVNAAKYTRQLIEWERLIDEAAKEDVAAINLARRQAAREANAPGRRLQTLDARRRALFNDVERLMGEIMDARSRGELANARRLQRSVDTRIRRLLRILREMQRLADAEDTMATVRTADGGVREVRLADELARQRREIITRRGISGRAPVTPEGERIRELPEDVEFVRQTRLARAVEAGESAPAVVRQIGQPEARRRVEAAARLDERAAALRRLEQELVDERAAATTAAQARRAEADIVRVRDEAASLERQAAEASQVPRNLEEVFDELKARLEFLGDRRVLSARLRSQKAFNDKTRAGRIRAARELRQIREKVVRNGRFTPEDIDALERVEGIIVAAEEALQRYASFGKRPKGVQATPPGFGVRSVRDRVGGPETAPRAVLREQAAGRRERESTLAARILSREGAPPLEGPVSIRSVRAERKRVEREASKNRREAKQIIERGRPVADNGLIRAIYDATSDGLAFEIMLERPIYVSIKTMRKQREQDFVATAELYGLDPVLYLGTRVGTFARARARGARREVLDISETARIPSSRLQRLTGAEYRRGAEDQRAAWQSLMYDTGTIRGAVAFQQEMRRLVEAVGVRINNVTEKEAALLNGERNINVTEAESVVFDARDYVALETGRAAERRIVTGVSEATGREQTMFDLFAREITEADVVKAGEDYILIPRYMYNAMERELKRITYRPSDLWAKADAITKQWRNFTLNIFPRTGFANLFGSAVLAAFGGAGPKSFYLAYRYIKYGDVPGPTQLRQRFALTLTTEAEFAGLRTAVPALDSPLKGLAWWMNTMRRFNGVSEDFGRLAVWYSRAYKEAGRLADDAGFRDRLFMMRGLTNDMEELLERFANNDPEYAALAARFTDDAFEFVGDLHSGGELNTKLRIAFPFQQWYRHILRLTLITMPVKYPGRALFLQKLSEIGREYQKENGVLPPWFMDVMPIFMEEKIVDGIPQEYIFAWRTSNLNPFATAAELFRGNQLNVFDYGAGALTPIWKNAPLMLYSALSGKAKKIGTEQLTADAKNQYGLTIDTASKEGIAYIANLLFQSLPGNSMALSMAGQSAEGNLFKQTVKLQRGDEGYINPEALPPDVYGRDFNQLVSDFSYGNLLAFLTRIFIGGAGTFVTGRGFVEDSQFRAFLRRTKGYETSEEKREANVRAILERYEKSQREAGE